MKKILLTGLLTLTGAFAFADNNASKVADSIQLVDSIEACYLYEFEFESLTVYSNGDFDYYYYYETGIICD